MRRSDGKKVFGLSEVKCPQSLRTMINHRSGEFWEYY